MRVRNYLILVFGLSVSLAGAATGTEAVQGFAAVPPAQEAAAPVQAPAATGVVAPAAGTNDSAAALGANAAAAAAPAKEDPIVCKKTTETGTLGRKKKVCMTASEWEQRRNAARDFMRRIYTGAGAQQSGNGG